MIRWVSRFRLISPPGISQTERTTWTGGNGDRHQSSWSEPVPISRSIPDRIRTWNLRLRRPQPKSPKTKAGQPLTTTANPRGASRGAKEFRTICRDLPRSSRIGQPNRSGAVKFGLLCELIRAANSVADVAWTRPATTD